MFTYIITGKKTGMRWSASMLQLGARLYAGNKSSMRVLQRNGLFIPSASTCARNLQKHMHTGGHNTHWLELMNATLRTEAPKMWKYLQDKGEDWKASVQLDEVHVRSEIMYNAKSKAFTGFALDTVSELHVAGLFSHLEKEQDKKVTKKPFSRCYIHT